MGKEYQSDPRLQVAQAEDLQDLLNHIGWEGVIKPRLDKLKQDYSSQLAKTLLLPSSNSNAPSALQLAARIEGIDFVISTIASILREGARAAQLLESTSWTITPSNSNS